MILEILLLCDDFNKIITKATKLLTYLNKKNIFFISVECLTHLPCQYDFFSTL